MEVNFFMPKYMKDFKCIGSKCKDTCCAGWEINIDEETFKKYKNSEGKLKELLKDKYRENPIHEESLNYGFMNVKKDMRCPFLNDNMLCDIHGDCGEDNLSITCKRYPRVFNVVDGIYEKSGIPSCEEVCLNAFLNKEKMEFIEDTEELDEEALEVRRIIDCEAFFESENLLQYFWQVRIISINIMQTRKYSIEERLNILRSFYKKLDDLKKMDDLEKIEEILDMLSEEEFDYNKFKGEAFKENDSFYNSIVEDKLFNSIKGNRLKVFLKEFRGDILREDNEYIHLTNKINDKTALENYNYIMENYLVNQIFKDIIPFNKGGNLEKSIEYLINTYRIIKAYIIGFSKYSKTEITDMSIIRVIQALSKDLEHNKVFKEILEI